jgi:hypothetical protein
MRSVISEKQYRAGQLARHNAPEDRPGRISGK